MSKLLLALHKAQSEFEVVEKSASNPFFKSKYAPLPEVLKSALPVLNRNGLGISQLPNGLGLLTIVFHESGEYMGSTGFMHLAKDDPQGQAAAITYMRRVAMLSVLGMCADEDDDGNLASNTGAKEVVQSNSAPRRVYQKAADTHSPENAKEYGVPEGHAARNESARVISSNIAKRNLLDAANLILNDEAVAKGVAAGVWQDEAKGLSTVGSSKLGAMIEETKLRASAINLGAELTD